MILKDTILLQESILSSLDTISLKEIKTVSLLKRRDSKYSIAVEDLESLLLALQTSHYVLSIENKNVQTYQNTYYDTPDFQMYLKHHNKNAHRYKIRTREYLESQNCFLEIKQRSNKGVHLKKRIAIPHCSINNNLECQEWINSNSPFIWDDLTPIIGNHFQRITLVDKNFTERLTIDLNIQSWNMHKSSEIIEWTPIAIVELKRKMSTSSNTLKILRDLRFKPQQWSKYAIAISCLFPEIIKTNRFKRTLNFLSKES